MANRSLGSSARFKRTVAAAACLVVSVCSPAPAPQQQASPIATTLAPSPPAETNAAEPTAGGLPASALPPPADATPAASPAAAPTAPNSAAASAEPSPSPPDPARKAEEDRLRSELAAAKAKAEALSTQATTECPDLKPGELRHPGAISRCNRLKSDAAQAVSDYEAVKAKAQAAGIAVQ